MRHHRHAGRRSVKAADIRAAIAEAALAATKPRANGTIPNSNTQMYVFLGALEGGLRKIDPALADQVEKVGEEPTAPRLRRAS